MWIACSPSSVSSVQHLLSGTHVAYNCSLSLGTFSATVFSPFLSRTELLPGHYTGNCGNLFRGCRLNISFLNEVFFTMNDGLTPVTE